jgi:hypothetical protein
MPLSLYDVSVPVFLHSLGNVKTFLQKAVAYAETRKFDPNVLVGARLAPDMFPLSNQVQFAGDSAKGAAARLTGTEAPKFEDSETTIEQLIARVDKTIVYLRGFDAGQFEGAETRIVTLNTPRGAFSFPGLVFLRHWALPNFLFHVTTTYNLLRHNGVDVGKVDYLGPIET